jgi:hypothetical protein
VKGTLLNSYSSWHDFLLYWMSSIISVAVRTFQARSWIIFHFHGKDSTHAPGLRSWARMHRRRNIYVFYTDWSIKRYQMNDIWLFIVKVYPVRCSKQKIYFITGSFDFSNIANWQLCVNNGAILTVKAQDYNPLWTVKFLSFTLLKLNNQERIMSNQWRNAQ